MKNNTRKKNEIQESYRLPTTDLEFINHITKQEIKVALWSGEDFDKELGLYPGDIVLYRPTNEINENQLTLFKPANKETFYCGFAYENFNEIGIIDPFYKNSDKTYKKREVTLLGVIVGIVKPYDAQKFPNFPYEIEAQSEEITAVCDDCKTTLSGTSKFIKSQGWSLGKKETLCLNCDLFGGEK